LILIDRDNSPAVTQARNFLEGYCEDKVEFYCGKAHKDDK